LPLSVEVLSSLDVRVKVTVKVWFVASSLVLAVRETLCVWEYVPKRWLPVSARLVLVVAVCTVLARSVWLASTCVLLAVALEVVLRL
jgi:hypothetical protein